MKLQHLLLNSRAALASRLREERERLRFHQTEMAERLGVSRSTQVCYEKASTEPTTGYIRAAQGLGVDAFKVLYGENAGFTPVDWPRLQQCAEAVEFFCLRFAPSCPTTYRWKMIRELYEALSKTAESQSAQTAPENFAFDTLKNIWDNYGK